MILLSAAMGIEHASDPVFMFGILKKIDKDENGKYVICGDEIIITPYIITKRTNQFSIINFEQLLHIN